MSVYTIALVVAGALVALLYGVVWSRWWARDRRRRRERLAERERQRPELEEQMRRLRLHIFDQCEEKPWRG